MQAQARRGDDRERSLAAAQQAGEVVTRVVLLEPVEAADDATVGQHRLDADELTPGRAVAQHVHAARVGRDRAADRRDVARAEIDAVLPARVARLPLQPRQRHARPAR